MAILDEIQCRVDINGTWSLEYDCISDEDDPAADDAISPGTQVVKYIESQADQNFTVWMQLAKEFTFENFNTLSCDILIDGVLAANPLLLPKDASTDGTIATWRGSRESFVDGGWPLATFTFCYRSLEVLQQMGIIEQPLATRPLEDRPFASLTPEEVKELIRRQKELIQQQDDTNKFMKRRMRESEARHNLRTLDSLKRTRSPSPEYKLPTISTMMKYRL